MRTLLVIMTGIGFTLGVVFGLLLQLPIDNTLPADVPLHRHNYSSSNTSSFRSRRSLSETEENMLDADALGFEGTESDVLFKIKNTFSKLSLDQIEKNVLVEKVKQDNVKAAPKILSEKFDLKPIKVRTYVFTEALKRPAKMVAEIKPNTQNYSETQSGYNSTVPDLVLGIGSFTKSTNTSNIQGNKLGDNSNAPVVVSVKLNLQKRHTFSTEKIEAVNNIGEKSHEDASYMSNIVSGILWTHQLEKSCPKPFHIEVAEAWRSRVQELDVVRMEEGCGRMQNRLVTFRDGSKACARYRLNTDQIQGEIFSYYLARLFNVSNIPPTTLAQVETLSSKWRTVHLQLSLAQWADTKLVVLTQHIDKLLPAHIPAEFREDGRRLEPITANLGSKSHSQLCELVQWSDLIVFDYLTANLDRVINNMFNRQWNDQMMSSPAHNLEQQADGSLVFLDNESGLFHGYRLLDKYSTFHRALLQSLCVFRWSTVQAVKRLHDSSSIGDELHKLFTSNEVLHKHLPTIPDKNIKILQQRVDDIYKQILHCDRLFNR